MNALAMPLYGRGAAIQQEREVGISRLGGFVSRDSQGSEHRSRQIAGIRHGAVAGAGAVSAATGQFSADRDDVHVNTSSSMGSTYRSEDMDKSTLRGKKLHLTPQCVDQAIGPIIRNRSVKTVAHAAGRSDETVKKWRTMVPEAWAAFINLLTSDDEVYLAVMELAGRKPETLTSTQRDAVTAALRILEGRT